MDAPSLHWETHEYEDKKRNSDWFWAVGILTIGVAVTSVILNNVLFAIVVILASFGLLLYAARKPKVVDVVLDDKGVRVHDIFYPYHTLESFWVEDQENHPRILIKSQKLFMPYIHVPLGDPNLEEVRDYLISHIPEVFHSESIFHKIIDRLGF